MNALSSLGRLRAARLWRLIRCRVLEDAPAIGVGAAVAVAANLLGLLVARRAAFNAGHGELWTASIALGGLILAASAFRRMHEGRAGTEWILLPAEPAEKYLAALVEYVVLLPPILSAAAAGLSALLAAAERSLGGPGALAWTPAAAGGLLSWARYAVAALFFLAGSASFRKAAFLKTVGVVASICLAGGLVLLAGFWACGRGSLHVSVGEAGRDLVLGGRELSAAASRAISALLGVCEYGLAPLFALLFGLAKVAEKEARDEVQ